MSEDNPGFQERDERLERELRELAPLILRRRRAEAMEVDAVFARALEQRLVGEEATNTGVSTSHATRPARLRRPRPIWTGFAAAVLVAAALVLLVLSRQHPSVTTHVAFVPRPTTADLIRNYPSFMVGGGGGGMEFPISSPIVTFGGAYPVRLHFSASHVPTGPATLPAYRLAGSSFDVARTHGLARQLGISAPITYWNDRAQVVPPSRATWIVTAVGVPPSRLPLHSLAISLHTGELLYHDLRSVSQSHAGPAIGRDRAVTLARAWLGRLGWPEKTMPVLSAGPPTMSGPTSTAMLTAVTFGWPYAGDTNVPAGVVWVAPGGRVVEALVWPPIVKRQLVGVRPIQTAWSMVQSGKAPIALHGNIVGLPPTGVGSEMQVSVVQVLVTPRHGSPQLVPAYRFSGMVQLEDGQGVHTWFALVPAASH